MLEPSERPDAIDRSARRETLAAALVATGMADRTAFARVYQMSAAKLFGVCLRICGERQAAEDVLQEVYLIVWRRAATFEPQRASPITWLATIARNRAIDWRRAQGTRRAVALDEAPDVADSSPDAFAAMESGQDADRLHTCLALLEERQKASIRTAFFDGVTYAELADRAGVPLGTMKSWVRRGLARLKDCLGRDA